MADDYDPIADVWKSVDVAHDALRKSIAEPAAAIPRNAFTYQRDELDFYAEPGWVSELLIDAEKYQGKVLDPCCGNGNIGRAFERRRHPIRSTDYAVRPYGECGKDFLDPATDYGTVDHIVCNPPFRHTEAFIVRALGIVRRSAAFLVPLKWLASQTRYDFFETYGRPARVYVLSNRASMPPGEFLDPDTGLFAADDPNGKWKAGDVPSGGAIDYCWVVFVPGYGGPTDMRWLSKGGGSKALRRKASQVRSGEGAAS
jgi:hypothetical protein